MVQISKQPRVWTGTQWDTLAVTLPDLSNYSTTTQMNTSINTTAGLNLITSGSISGTASSISLSNVFTSTYKNYRLIFQGNDTSGNSELRIRLRQNTTDYTSNLYSFGGLQVTSNAVRSDVYGNNISYFYCGFFTNLTSPVSDVSYVVMDINYEVPANVKVNYQFWDAYFYRGGYGSGSARSMTNGNGLTIYSANGNNITGSWSLYGYK